MGKIRKTVIGRGSSKKSMNISSGVLSDSASQRIFENVYQQINRISESQKEGVQGSESTKGKVGDVRVTKQDSGSHTLEAKTKDGWASVNINLEEE